MARPQSFSTSFWTPDYISGVNVLFDKLEQGVAENAQVLAFLSSRISVESAYAANLETTARDVQTGSAANAGFNRDEGASLKQAFTSILDESRIQGQEHSRIAAHLERLVRGPFAQYSGDHRQRIADAKASLIGQIRNYHKATLQVSKAQQAYFTKARQLEDFSDSTVPKIVTSPISSSPTRQQKRLSQLLPQTPPSHTSNLPPGAPANCPDVHIGSMVYPYDKFCLLLKSMTSTIPQETLRITLLGSYEHVIEGEQLVSYARKYVNLKSLGDAERFGQWLVDHGFLRLVGAVGSRFSGSTNSKYQWQPAAFAPETVLNTAAVSGTPTSVQTTPGSVTTTPNGAANAAAAGGLVSPNSAPRRGHKKTFSLVSGYLSGFIGDGDESTRESQMSKLQREITEADKKYQESVLSLDKQRCQLEQNIYEKLGYMQQCERDRLAAVKTVLKDFSTAVSKSFAVLERTTERMCLHEETIDTQKDFCYLVDRYRTGEYAPQPVTYNNFFKRGEKIQTFGVDLENSAYLVPQMLDFLTAPQTLTPNGTPETAPAVSKQSDEKEASDKTKDDDEKPEDNDDTHSTKSDKTAEFPSVTSKPGLLVTTETGSIMPNRTKFRKLSKESRQLLLDLWTSPSATMIEIQGLRNLLNTGSELENFNEIVSTVPLPVVISTIKDFLLELPDSIVTSTVYDSIKNTYAPSSKHTPEEQIDRIVSLLSHLARVHIETLQLLITHFAELANLPEDRDLTADEPVPEAVDVLSQHLARYILRPRINTAVTLADKHPQRFLREVLLHRFEIFGRVLQRLEAARSRSRSTSNADTAATMRRQNIIEARQRELIASPPSSSSSSSSPTLSPPQNALRPLALSSSNDLLSVTGMSAASANSANSGGLVPPSASGLKHKRSFSGANRPPLSMFLGMAGEVKRAE
ncbi:hypothetical protein DV113_004816 [Geotrichum candidum]|uniref:Similar to Saccharomyces cerevisiae YFL047W RGD2 GTPase-activating protein (RhoGAP) for Cdc42p and Rho5p n=1 Tax=Geotrichum candidum TaxID=1173061 RepID=A0A0J9XJ53_GEOCN|nr:hypothetical protein DV113_004816 [Geotrichum candidum]CDO57334.1 similar to Saccharomyces cerevisiae YFL047W RGD2 GTPase-activating protein (RhoGAP) for Cdc42p and Rho5p [Geotrichum candidum]